MPILYYDQGQLATITLETAGKNVDKPVIHKVFSPEFKELTGFPAPMYKLDKNEEGIYVARFKIPTGSAASGTYLCLVKWIEPETKLDKKIVYTIIVKRNIGINTAVSTA